MSQAPVVVIEPGAVRGIWRNERSRRSEPGGAAKASAPGSGSPGNPGTSAAFLGIPFAQAPVGELRFAAPVPPEPWEGVRDAIEFGATAQRGDTGFTLIPEPSVPGDATLNVNVYTPEPGNSEARLPVLVWIHGGGYVSGSPASPWYDGRTFARDGVVVVTISYRLGFDGFGDIPGAPSNRGVRDWLAALEWVQTNIAAFGGDPTRVTIGGQSAGGGAVLTLLAMPAAQHLFHSVWASSAATSHITADRARATSKRLAALAGVAATRAGFASVPEQRLIDLQRAASAPQERGLLAKARAAVAAGVTWGPTIDDDLLTQQPVDAMRQGVGADKHLVLGANDDEFTLITDRAKKLLRLIPPALTFDLLGLDKKIRRTYLADNAPQVRKGTAAIVGRYITDVTFRAPVVRVAQARGTAPTWVYRFEWVSPARGWSLHCLDVPFLYDCLDAPKMAPLTGDNPPQSLADDVHGAAVEFARTGEPGWPAWSGSPGTTRVFDTDLDPAGSEGDESNDAGSSRPHAHPTGPARPSVINDGYAEVRALV